MNANSGAGSRDGETQTSAIVAGRRATRPKVPSFHLFGPSLYAPSQGWKLVNEAELFPRTGIGVLSPPGTHDRGFPSYPATPHFQLIKRPRQKLYDFEKIGDFWIVSERAKRFLSEQAASDCAFLACRSDVPDSMELRAIWLFDVITVLDAVDMSRSSGIPRYYASGRMYYDVITGSRLTFDVKVVGAHRFFRLQDSHDTIVCDHGIKTLVKEAGLTGMQFRDPENL
jgi:hypothetical protein